MNRPTEHTNHSRPCILVIEDDPALRRSIQLLLHGKGFDVRAYAAPELLLLDNELEDAVCLVADYRLGKTDGIEVLGALRRTGWRGPAILVTAYSTGELGRLATEAGFDALLEKPFQDHVLVNTITRLTASPPSP